MASSIDDAVAVLLRSLYPDFTELTDCRQLTAGASQETWCISFSRGAGTQRLALRRAQPTATSSSSVGQLPLATEAALFQLAGSGDIPGPEVIHVLKPEDRLGEGFVMSWLEGETLGQRINRAEELSEARETLARQCGETLGRIHALDWQALDLNEPLPTIDPAQLVEDTWMIYRDLDVPVPMIDYCWRWLTEHLPRDSRQTLVHGDFRNGNLMVTPRGIEAVLDWELAHIGDPLRDLGWLCVNSWRFGQSDKPVGGFGEIDELLAGYHSTSGIEVSREELRFWQVFGSFWWSMATLQMADAWRTGETPSLERPVIGRRSSEAQMDCVSLLFPGDFTLPESDQAISDGTQLPMPAELLQGSIDFLRNEVASALDGHNSFLARVAANSLGIAQREFTHGPALAATEQARLTQLLDKEADLDSLRRELVQALRKGMPLDTPGLTEHLRQSVAGQLFIDQPRYSALRR